ARAKSAPARVNRHNWKAARFVEQPIRPESVVSREHALARRREAPEPRNGLQTCGTSDSARPASVRTANAIDSVCPASGPGPNAIDSVPRCAADGANAIDSVRGARPRGNALSIAFARPASGLGTLSIAFRG